MFIFTILKILSNNVSKQKLNIKELPEEYKHIIEQLISLLYRNRIVPMSFARNFARNLYELKDERFIRMLIKFIYDYEFPKTNKYESTDDEIFDF